MFFILTHLDELDIKAYGERLAQYMNKHEIQCSKKYTHSSSKIDIQIYMCVCVRVSLCNFARVCLCVCVYVSVC